MINPNKLGRGTWPYAQSQWMLVGIPDGGARPVATGYTVTGPSGGTVGVASSDFTIQLTGGFPPLPDGVGIGISRTPGLGTLLPGNIFYFTGNTTVQTFTYTPDAAGVVAIGFANDVGFSNPADINYTATAAPATGYSFSGPSSGLNGSPSSNFTVALTPSGGTVAGTVTVTPSDGGGGGTFTPTTVGLTTGAPSATFTYTPASTGAKTLSVTNNGGLTNPGNLTYTSNATGLVDGDPVSSWLDSSGNGHTASNTGSARPIYKTGIINGQPVVRFSSASATKLNLGSTINADPPWTIITVLRSLSTSNSIGSLFSDGTNTSPFGLLLNSDGSVYVANRANFGYVGPYGVGAIVATSFPNGTGTPILYVNGTVIPLSGVAVSGTGNFANIGQATDNGDIAEIILYNSELGATNRANVEKYLGTKYGLTVAGGSAVQPDTVGGLVAWWKADSL